jgi:hypothetical protein
VLQVKQAPPPDAAMSPVAQYATGKNPAHSVSKKLPVDQRRQAFTSSWRMSIMSVKRGRKRSSCSGPRDLGFIARSEIAGFWPKTYQILQLKDTKNTTS